MLTTDSIMLTMHSTLVTAPSDTSWRLMWRYDELQVTGTTSWIGAMRATTLGLGWRPAARTRRPGPCTSPGWFRSYSHPLASFSSAGGYSSMHIVICITACRTAIALSSNSWTMPSVLSQHCHQVFGHRLQYCHSIDINFMEKLRERQGDQIDSQVEMQTGTDRQLIFDTPEES